MGIISIGDKIEMEILIHGHTEQDETKRRVFNSKVMDLPGVNIYRITMPFFEGRIVPLSIGDQYSMNFFASKGIYGSRFVVVNRLKEGNIFLADVEMQEPLKKVQRREYFRHDCRIAASYRMFNPVENAIKEEDPELIEWKKGVILDISGGGVRMVSEFKEDNSKMIQLRFPIIIDNHETPVEFYGRLIASYPNKNNRMLFEQRVEFDGITAKEREKLIKFIFDEERKKISKSRGL